MTCLAFHGQGRSKTENSGAVEGKRFNFLQSWTKTSIKDRLMAQFYLLFAKTGEQVPPQFLWAPKALG